LVGEAGNAEDVVEVDDVGAVEVGRTVAAAQVKRIVAVVEEAQPLCSSRACDQV